tara:strand:+ start:7753 stop:8718 length:966 start_codon:yes stop_codon:yes gene_type:complete
MTEQLTKEQEIIVEQNKKEWLNKFFGYDSTTFSKERCTKAIKSLYAMCGLIEPDVIIVDSPHAAQITANKLAGTENVFTYFSIPMFSNYGNYSDLGWLAFYDTFLKLGVTLDKDLLERFKVMVEIIESGCFMSIQLEGLCIVSKMPIKLNHDEENRLHSIDEPSVVFLDGYKQYYVANRFIEAEIFEACDDLKKAKSIFFNEENEDVKAVMCFIIRERYGDRRLLEMLNADLYAVKKIHHNEGYTETLKLYRTSDSYEFLMDSKEIPNQPYCWLEYTCPSTNTIYLIDTFADFKCPLEAAKFHRPNGIPFDTEYKWEYFAN